MQYIHAHDFVDPLLHRIVSSTWKDLPEELTEKTAGKKSALLRLHG